MKKNTIVIGDVHGRENWKKIVKEHPNDRIVFLGDYCDPYENRNNFKVLSNFIDIIQFKTKRKDDVILLLGNHDMHYLYDSFPVGSRYNAQIAKLLKSLLEERRNYFQFAYQEGNTLYTHAGVCSLWWNKYFKGLSGKDAPSIADQLNNPSEEQLKAMFMVGHSRGGNCECSGIFWADAYETNDDPLVGVHQVVGHTMMVAPLTVLPTANTSITYCDCLKNGRYYSIDNSTE